jgi:hypothetical protein
MRILSSFTIRSSALGVIYVFKGRHSMTVAGRPSLRKPHSAALGTTLVVILVVASLILGGGISDAAIVPTITMGTADDYSVLAGTTVTNTGATVLEQSLGLSPGTAITGFPPGVVTPPAVIEAATPAAEAAQLDLTTAYDEASARPLDETVTSDLGGLTLVGGVYAGPLKSALSLTGNLILDGAGDPNSVFILQTDTTLTTAAGSTVTLINGAQECNVFWQVGSSATLGASSTLVGTILALTSITVGAGVAVQGRTLARNGAVTLDSDTFSTPTCDLTAPTTTTIPTTTTTIATTTTALPTTTTTIATTTTLAATTTTDPTTSTTLPTPTTIMDTTTTLEVSATTLEATPSTVPATSTTDTAAASGSTTPTELPFTGSDTGPAVIVAALALVAGIAMVGTGRTARR